MNYTSYKSGDIVLINLEKSRGLLGCTFYKQLIHKNGVAKIVAMCEDSDWVEITVNGINYNNNIYLDYIVGRINVNFKIL